MSPRKRRTQILDLDLNQEEDRNQATLKQCRRSSLQVNLSFVSNLDDSGNVSQTSDPLQATGSSSRMLLDMNNKEAALEKSCSNLKTAILSKTKEIFDKHNEFSIKTIQILLDRLPDQNPPDRNPPVLRTPTRSPRVQLAIKNDQQIIMSDHGSQHPVQIRSMSGSGSKSRSRRYRITSPRNEIDLDNVTDDSSIFVTPKKGKTLEARSFSDLNLSAASVSKKRLFYNWDNHGKDLDREKGKSRRHRPRGLKASILGNSPILGGSNKRVLKKTRRKLPVTGSGLRSENESGTELDSSVNTLEDGSVHLGYPVTCSTFIQDDSDSQEENRQTVGKGIMVIQEQTPETPSNLSSMEITSVCGKILAVQERSGKNGENNSKEKEGNRISRDLTKTEARVLLERVQVKKNSNTGGNGRILLEGDSSINTVRTSLNVNTSIDEVLEKERGSVGSPSKDTGEIPDKEISGELEKKQTEDSESLDSLENLSLIQRLRNNSGEKSRNENSRCDNLLEVLENSGGNRRRKERSIVEATPFPASRSMLVKSHLKGLTLDLDPISSESSTSEGTSRTKSFRRLDVRRRRTLLDTIILEDSAEECDGGKHRLVREPKVIGESSDEEGGRKAKPVQKRKLLPLRQNSDLFTFSPVENVEKKASDDRKKYVKKKKKKKRRNVEQKEVEKEVENRTEGDGGDNVEEEQEEIEVEEPPEEDEEVAEENLDLSESEEPKKRRKRKVVSKKVVVKRNAELDVFERLKKKYEQPASKVPQRNSLNDFQTQSRVPSTAKCCKRSKIVIVTTGLCKGDKELVKSVIKSLGGAKLESNVSRHTTHVVTTGVRTINLLHGIIRGCWLISMEWILKSLEEDRWLDPEGFEIKHFSQAVLENRRDRQLFGKSYVPELFTTCGFIYIENGTSPPTAVLKDLIKTAGGLITENPRNAKIIIGLEGLREIWVLDSITTGEIQPFQQYRRN